MFAVRPFQAGDAPAATAIVRGLPDYFTEDVPDKVEHDAASHQAWVITDSGTVAGFAVAARKSSGGRRSCGSPSMRPAAASGTEPGCSATSWTA
jgi:hypothetical protein